MSPKQSLSVHAHFYQPPREDPMTGAIPHEAGAWPFDNWNERIFNNCYKPNAELGNFSRISFNLGPTLSEWMRATHPNVLDQIVQADQQNCARHGAGNAIAQPYNHTILPLATRRDKQTQIRWGIHEFVRTFKRQPQGMWLPETAVDLETLAIMAENGIEFTILAPWQADGHDVDPRKAYQVILPQHKTIKVFFYHSGLSSRVSFDPSSTNNADHFVRDFVKPEFSSKAENQWLMLASDGELYGHHQIFRDKFLAHLMNGSLTWNNLDFSYPALQLQKQKVFPVMKIRENTSWSCHHGVQRWRGVCSCTPNSEWKKHLRESLERLANELDRIYESYTSGFLENPWEARDRFVEVFLKEKPFEDWFRSQSQTAVSEKQLRLFRDLFTAQADGQRMFTSCGWFFDDFDRIEPRNNIAYAAHAVWLIKRCTQIDLAPQITPHLEKVKSWSTGITAASVFFDAMQRFERSSNS